MRIGLIGLGVMGWRIGANLAKAERLHVVYNRTSVKAEQFSREYGVRNAESITTASGGERCNTHGFS